MGNYPTWLQPNRHPLPQGRRHNADGVYELLKRRWIELHPDATPAEYTAAMQQLAKQAGV